ncbi:hypothetical protein B0H10DRAFT_2234985 [Mycena sp. CBHHK59/15]|nr:hypothetical protein B0H10DRAFT_2234985 [Mycena sp. CBHHK59/15]
MRRIVGSVTISAAPLAVGDGIVLAPSTNTAPAKQKKANARRSAEADADDTDDTNDAPLTKKPRKERSDKGKKKVAGPSAAKKPRKERADKGKKRGPKAA